MKINVAKSAGFCFGVKRALRIASEAAKSKEKVYMLGDIVHNEDVASDIRKAGIKTIKFLSNGKGKTLIIRAHGTASKIAKKALLRGFKIIDATCPMVKEIHKIAKDSERKGYQIIIIGDKKHDEVKGIAGQLQNPAIVIDKAITIPKVKLNKIKKVAVVTQSTQNLESVLKIIEVLKKNVKELKFFNTICRPTRIKQEEIRIMPLKNDVMVIIGSKTSANTRRLYQISKSLNKNSFWVQSKNNIKTSWFKNAKCVGITSGASTPNLTTQTIIEYINKIA